MFSWCQVIFLLSCFFCFYPSNWNEILKSHKILLTTLFSIFFPNSILILTSLSYCGSETLMLSSHVIELNDIFRLTVRFKIKEDIYQRPVFHCYRWLLSLWSCCFPSLVCVSLLSNKVYKSHLYYIFLFFLFNPACLLCTSGERHCVCEQCVIWIIISDEIYHSGHPYMSYWRILCETNLLLCESALG